MKQGDFNATTEKPTWLYSNFTSIAQIQNYATKSFSRKMPSKVKTCKRTKKKDGSYNVTGTKQLKGTQHYTREMGEALCKVFEANRELALWRVSRLNKQVQKMGFKVNYKVLRAAGSLDDQWEDADVGRVLAFLRR